MHKNLPESLVLASRFVQALRDVAYPAAMDERPMVYLMQGSDEGVGVWFTLPGHGRNTVETGEMFFWHEGEVSLSLPRGRGPSGLPIQQLLQWNGNGLDWDACESGAASSLPGETADLPPSGWGDEGWNGLMEVVLDHAVAWRDAHAPSGEPRGDAREGRALGAVVGAAAGRVAGLEVETFEGGAKLRGGSVEAVVAWDARADGCRVLMEGSDGPVRRFLPFSDLAGAAEEWGDEFSRAVEAARSNQLSPR